VTALFSLALAVRAKMQKQNVVRDRDVNFKCSLTKIIKFCARSDKVT